MNTRFSRIKGLLIGMLFGFLLHKGGATSYDVIVSQLLLTDFTVVKIMLSAVVTGMLGVYLLKTAGLVKLVPKSGSVGQNVIGGLIFGVGFALLGYCPGTIAGAIGNGWGDALIGGAVGIITGSALFALLYPVLNRRVLKLGEFGSKTIPELLKLNDWIVVIPVALALISLLVWLQRLG